MLDGAKQGSEPAAGNKHCSETRVKNPFNGVDDPQWINVTLLSLPTIARLHRIASTAPGVGNTPGHMTVENFGVPATVGLTHDFTAVLLPLALSCQLAGPAWPKLDGQFSTPVPPCQTCSSHPSMTGVIGGQLLNSLYAHWCAYVSHWFTERVPCFCECLQMYVHAGGWCQVSP